MLATEIDERDGHPSPQYALAVLAIEVERRGQALLEPDLGRPAERVAELAIVGVVVADVDRQPVLGERDDAVATGARETDDELGGLLEAHVPVRRRR